MTVKCGTAHEHDEGVEYECRHDIDSAFRATNTKNAATECVGCPRIVLIVPAVKGIVPQVSDFPPDKEIDGGTLVWGAGA